MRRCSLSLGILVGLVLGCAAMPLPIIAAPLAVSSAPRYALVQGVATLTFPIATSPSTANSYTYKAHFTLSSNLTGPSLPSALTPTTCASAPAGGSTCTGTVVTLPPDGTYHIQITSLKTVGGTTKESSKSAALTSQDIVQPPVTPGAPSSCVGCAPAPSPIAISLIAPAANATLTATAFVTFDTVGAAVRAEATVLDQADQFICTCQAVMVTGAPVGSQRWQVLLYTGNGPNGTYKVLATAYTATGTPASTTARTVTLQN